MRKLFLIIGFFLTVDSFGQSPMSRLLKKTAFVDTFIHATGGTITTDGNYKVHSFTVSGTFTVTANPNSHTVAVLVIAGGGAGGIYAAGGGGGGGYQYNAAYSVTTTGYTVTS